MQEQGHGRVHQQDHEQEKGHAYGTWDASLYMVYAQEQHQALAHEHEAGACDRSSSAIMGPEHGTYAGGQIVAREKGRW